MNGKLNIFKEYVHNIGNKENQKKFQDLLEFVIKEFPHLNTVVKWNQPMFIDHGTYIIAFNPTKNHINIAPERAAMIHFDELIQTRDVGFTKMLIQIKWSQPIDYDLIKEIITYNIIEKEHTTSFWR